MADVETLVDELAKLPPEEAIASLRRRVALTKGEFARLSAKERAQSFTVAGVVDLDIISETLQAITDAIAEGKTYEEFVETIGAKLEAEWGDSVANPGARLETIFRTNVQSAYSAGRYEQATDPDTLAVRPYWMFSAILDDRTTTICMACDGTVRPASDAWWHSHFAPLHMNCRSTVITLSEELAKEEGITHVPPRLAATAQNGFGGPPDIAWKPKATDYPNDAWREFHAKMAAGADARDARSP